ncbi:MAG: hypothetical protein H6817_04120 [Phycisphaerales bacterium]|nr:hypothetical protein [Phycisphaerales bacterium]
MSRSVLSAVFVVGLGCGAALGQHGSGHGFHVPMPNQELLLHCTYARGGEMVAVDQPFNPPSTMAPADINQSVALGDSATQVRIARYLPQAVRTQNVTADADGQPAVRLAIKGPKQAFDRWLIADDPLRNRLTSLIATWRYMAVADDAQRDDLYRQFEQELTRPAQVLIAGEASEPPAAIPARPGETYTDPRSGQTVKVLKFMPHFGMDQDAGEAVNQSDKRINPAVLVEVKHGGEKEEHWLFAKFPEFKMHGDAATPLRMRLDCPVEVERPAPDLVIVTVAKSRQEVWIRHEGKVHAEHASLNEAIKIPASNYVCTIEAFVPSGKLVETYVATDNRNAVTAIEVDVPDASGSNAAIWLEMNKPRVVDSPLGTLTLTFTTRQAVAAGGH